LIEAFFYSFALMLLANRVKNNLSWVFLTAFILIKVAGLHGIVHSDDVDDTQDCIWCHLAGTDEKTPLISSSNTFEIEEPVLQEHHFIISNYSSLATEKTPFCLIYNKPPPFYTV